MVKYELERNGDGNIDMLIEELTTLTQRRGLELMIEFMMVKKKLPYIREVLLTASTVEEWNEGMRLVKAYMYTVLNNDFPHKGDAEEYLRTREYGDFMYPVRMVKYQTLADLFGGEE